MGEEKGKRKGCGGGGKSGVGREGERAGRRGEILAWCLSWKNGLLVAEQLRIKNAAKSNIIYSLLHIQQLQTQHMTLAAAAKSLQSCLTLQPHKWQPTRLPHPWDSPGKNTGVGCHFLFHCMKVKSESEVAQSCPTPSNPMDCSLPGFSIHGIFQARVLEWVVIAFSV